MTICGLENFGNTCYSNSILQLFMQCDSVLDFIYKIKENNNSNIVSSIQKFIHEYKTNTQKKTFRPKILPDLFFEKLFQPFQQYDAHEFLIHFLDILDEETKKILSFSTSKKFFQYHYYTIIKTVQEETKTIHTETILTLPFSDSLEDSLDLFHKIERIEEWESEILKKKVPAEKSNIIFHWPQYLFVQINRYDDNFNKITKSMKFPLFFDNYHFNGAVVHYGSNNFGHYISIVKKKDVFFLIDDERITQISDEDAQNYISFSYLLLYSK